MTRSSDELRTKFLTVRLEPSLHDELTRLAKTNDRSLAAELRVALRRHLAIVNPEQEA